MLCAATSWLHNGGDSVHVIHVVVLCPPLCLCLQAPFGAVAIAVSCRAAIKRWYTGGNEGWMLPKGCLRGMNNSSKGEGGIALNGSKLFLYPLAAGAGQPSV